MKFVLEVEVAAKWNTDEVLNRVIERASDAVLKDRTVKMVDVRGRVVDEPKPEPSDDD